MVWVGKVALLIVIAVILQTLVVSRISILGVTADLFLVLTVLVGLGAGALQGALLGFFAGVIHDMIFFQPLGAHALIFVLTGYFAGMFLARFGTVNLWAIFILTGAISFASQLAFGVLQFAMGPKSAFLTMIGTQMVPEAVFDALIAVPIYILLLRTRVLRAPDSLQKASREAAE